MSLLRKCSIVYLCLLTALLLSSDPRRFLPDDARAGSWLVLLAPYAHFVSFAVLTVLFLSAWPGRWVSMLSAITTYALATELLQKLVPTRTADAADFLQDVAGIVCGAAVWVAATRLIARRVPRQPPA